MALQPRYMVFASIFVIGVVALAAKMPPHAPAGLPAPPATTTPSAATPTPAAATSTPAPAASSTPAAPATAWTVPDPDTLPDDDFGRTVRHGRDLIARTSSLIGPDAPDPAKRYAGNGLDCQSCHLRAGTQQFGIPLAGIWGTFPRYIGRENETRSLEQRVNGCMERSMNGRALPADAPEMTAILTYIHFISGSEQPGQAPVGVGTPPLPLLDRAADPVRGRAVYAETCAACHGADGLGQRLDASEAAETGRRYRFPPLWGPDSYNDGAGMARTITASRFVHGNMPYGTTFDAPLLDGANAFDVMAFVNTQPRPQMAGLEADYPDRAVKPVDAGYPPFVGPFPPDQHRYGPWKPIQEWLRANPAAARATP